MFQGEEIRKLDEKSRVIVPPKFRHFVGKEDRVGFFLTVIPFGGGERCIRMYTPTEWGRVTAALKQLAVKSRNPDGFARVFSSHSEFVEMDAQHRLLVPQRLIEFAGLERKSDLVLVGCTNHIQLWNLNAWRSMVAEDRGSIEEVKDSVRGIFGGYGGGPV